MEHTTHIASRYYIAIEVNNRIRISSKTYFRQLQLLVSTQESKFRSRVVARDKLFSGFC